MQILYLTPKTDSPQDRLCRDTAERLKRYFNDNGNDYALCIMHYAVNNSPAPDVVHLFGKPDAAAARCLHRAHRLHIPIIISPLGITNIPSQHILDIATYIHACSPTEAKAIATNGNDNGNGNGNANNPSSLIPHLSSSIITIPNPLLTHSVTAEQTASQFAQLYADTIADNDERVTRQMVANITKAVGDAQLSTYHFSLITSDIALWVLKSQLFIARRKLPHTFLLQFADTLNHQPYNEDQLIALLRAMKLRALMGRLLQIMAETAQLTEGFMPMPPIDDRITEKIRKTIV